MDMDISNHNEKSRKSRKYLCRMTQIFGFLIADVFCYSCVIPARDFGVPDDGASLQGRFPH